MSPRDEVNGIILNRSYELDIWHRKYDTPGGVHIDFWIKKKPRFSGSLKIVHNEITTCYFSESFGPMVRSSYFDYDANIVLPAKQVVYSTGEYYVS